MNPNKKTKRSRYIETTCPICGLDIIMERTKFGYRPRDYGEEYHLCKSEPGAEGVVGPRSQIRSVKDVCKFCCYNQTCKIGDLCIWAPDLQIVRGG